MSGLHQFPAEFQVVRYAARQSIKPDYLLSSSDAQPIRMQDLLGMADPEVKALWDNLNLGYTQNEGHPTLRQEIAKMYEGLDKDQVLLVAPQEGIFVAMQSMIAYWRRFHKVKDVHVVVAYPGYQSFDEISKTAGCDVTYWKIRIERQTNRWRFDIDDLKKLLREETRILVVNFPHSPTGYVPSSTDWQEIVDLCKSRGIYLFSDEIYRRTNNDSALPLIPACTLYSNAVTLCGLSKAYGLGGLRIGWLCTQNEAVMQMMSVYKDYITRCPATPSEILAIIALRNAEELIKRVKKIVDRNLKELDAFFVKYPHYFSWFRPNAGTTGFVELKGDLLPSVGGATKFCDTLLHEAGILVVPASTYDYDDSFFRVGFGRENVPEVLKVFEAYLNNRNGK